MSETATAEIDFDNPVPGDVKVYVARYCGSSLWTPSLDDAISELECAAEGDGLPFDREAVTKDAKALEPGDKPLTVGDLTVEVQMVDQKWLESLPEFDGF